MITRCASFSFHFTETITASWPARTGVSASGSTWVSADSTADPNRLFLSRTVTYRWLLANASRFGFVNYPFEPWHWEWTGETP